MNSNKVLNVLTQLSLVDEESSTILNESGTPTSVPAEGGKQVNPDESNVDEDDDKTPNETAKLNENAQLQSVTVEDDTVICYCKDCAQYFIEDDIYEESVCPLCGSDNTELQGAVIPDGITLEEGLHYDSESDEAYVLNESMKKVVIDGKVQSVQVKKKKHVKLSAKQKAALRKAGKKSHTSKANKSRAKSKKIRVTRGLSESVADYDSLNESLVVLPTDLVLNESLGVAQVSSTPEELEGIAKDLGFEYAEDCYIKEVGDSVLVLEEAEGDIEGVIIYGIDVTGNTVDEDTLATLLDQAGIDTEDADTEPGDCSEGDN